MSFFLNVILFGECHIESKLDTYHQVAKQWHLTEFHTILRTPHFDHNSIDGKEQNHKRQTVDNMIYVGHAEQFHIFHSGHYNSITMQTTVLDVKHYFKKPITPMFRTLLFNYQWVK